MLLVERGLHSDPVSPQTAAVSRGPPGDAAGAVVVVAGVTVAVEERQREHHLGEGGVVGTEFLEETK